MTSRDVTRFCTLFSFRAIFSTFSGDFLLKLLAQQENPLEKIPKNPVETVPRNCRFLSLIVAEGVLKASATLRLPQNLCGSFKVDLITISVGILASSFLVMA